MVYLEIVATLHLVVMVCIGFLLCAILADDEYKPPPMSKDAERMYS